jgi:hypothetical protein
MFRYRRDKSSGRRDKSSGRRDKSSGRREKEGVVGEKGEKIKKSRRVEGRDEGR